ncbi:MAG TPA: hypothetical protein VJQ57_04445 [Acidimicrobiia bacterium]|nr:hypothetical protein [Acidimicrobiia bacterium]
MREVRAVEFEEVMLATNLLQRARLAHHQAGLWEAADVQWWWRLPRRSDKAEKLFWVDYGGPVAGVLLTSWIDQAWQCDPVIVPGAPGPPPDLVWTRALEHAIRHVDTRFEVPVSDDDRAFTELAQRAGLTAGGRDSTGWMDAADRPAVSALLLASYWSIGLSVGTPCIRCAVEMGTGWRSDSPSVPFTTRSSISRSRPPMGWSPATRCTGLTRPQRWVSSNPSESKRSSNGEVSHERC